MNLPEGFTEHDGKGRPVDGEQFVVLVIRTNQGLGYSGPVRAKFHDWEQNEKSTLGHIVGWKTASPNEQVDLYKRWPE